MSDKICGRFRNVHFRCLLILVLGGIFAAWPVLAQNAASPSAADSVKAAGPSADGSPPPASARPLWRTHTSAEEGELIELDDVQIHGEIAQPNVAITISRAEPQFRKLTLEHIESEGLTDLDLSGLRGAIPPAERIRNWKEILNRPRQ